MKTSGGKNGEKLQALRSVVETDEDNSSDDGTLVCEAAVSGQNHLKPGGAFGMMPAQAHSAHAHAAAAAALRRKNAARRYRLPNGVTLTLSGMICFFATLVGMVLMLVYFISCCIFGFKEPTNVVVELTCFLLDCLLHLLSNIVGFVAMIC